MNIPIVFSTDHNYIMQTGVCIFSLLKSATTSFYDIYVLINKDVREDDKAKLREQVSHFSGHSIDFVEIGDQFEGCYETRGISTAAYSRLLIPWLLPELGKVIYSDVDVIFRIDLGEIYGIDISNYYFAGVPAIGAIQEFGKHVKRLHLVPENYINSGFLVINSKKQRDENLRASFIKETRKKYYLQDQDIINIVCKGGIKLVSPQYCITPAFYTNFVSKNPIFEPFYGPKKLTDDFLIGKNCILHYAGGKPWNTFTFAWGDWWDTYRESIFYRCDFEPEVSEKIIYPILTWRKIASHVKRKILFGLRKTRN